MASVTLLLKPVSGRCNGRCGYCFYEDEAGRRAVKDRGVMDPDTVRRTIASALEHAGPAGAVHVLFQGGEPTLAGLAFFRETVDMAQALCPAGTALSWALQTNGLALDEDWAAFLAQRRFLVGLSLDGTQALHDRFRRDAAGAGTWDRAAGALALLDRAGAETNLLCVVTGPAARQPEAVWAGLRALGDHSLQFIPCLDPLDGPAGGAAWSLDPADWGRFLRTVFDLWYGELAGGVYVSVRFFDDLLRLLAGMAPSTCAMAGRCGGYLAVEADGEMYPCDFYALDRWRLGNIRDTTVTQALTGPAMARFLAESAVRPAACVGCPWAPLCRGGCRRDWSAGPENRLCPAFRDFFPYALPRLRRAAQALGLT